MLDYRRKHRLAEKGRPRRPASEEVPLLPHPLRVTIDPQYELKYPLLADGENHEAQDKNWAAQQNPNCKHVVLHLTDVGPKYSQNIRQPENWKELGQITYQATRATDPWAHMEKRSTFAMLDTPITLRMRGHLHYCKSFLYFFSSEPQLHQAWVYRNMFCVICFFNFVVVPHQSLWLTSNLKVMNVIIASQHSVRSGIMIRLQDVWPALAQSNIGLLNAIIAAAASNQAVRDAEIIQPDPHHPLKDTKLRPHSVDYFFHQAEAIRFINENLSDPAEACSDATLGAVTFVICSDVSHPIFLIFDINLIQ
jgi:hypothetical protein